MRIEVVRVLEHPFAHTKSYTLWTSICMGTFGDWLGLNESDLIAWANLRHLMIDWVLMNELNIIYYTLFL